MSQDARSESPNALPAHPPMGLEIGWGLLILAGGLGLRALYIHYFPALPVSDFRALVDFGITIRDTTWAKDACGADPLW